MGKNGLTEEKGAFEVAETVLNAPREGLRSRNKRNADLNGDR